MSESIIISKGAEKAIVYEELQPQIRHLLQNEPDLITNLANISAVLKEVFGFFWVGFYWVQGEDRLNLIKIKKVIYHDQTGSNG